MAIPLRQLNRPVHPPSNPRVSLDSETAAILSYALGTHVEDNDSSDDDGMDSISTIHHQERNSIEEREDETFLKEHDPEYETFPQKKKSRRFRICVFSIVGIVLLLWIGALVGYLSKGYFRPHQAVASPVAASRRITFDQVTSGELYPRYKSLEWTSSLAGHDGVFLVRENGQIIRENVNGTKEVIVDEGDMINPASRTPLTFQKYWISGDEQYILLATNIHKNWRHSFTANYFIYDIRSRTTSSLIPNDADVLIDYAIWSPTSAKVAYVLQHDVYVHDLATSNTERVTFDGGEEVFNGVADWVFEEEVFASPGCIWWSPSSEYLAYIHINESAVPVYSIPYYIPDSPIDAPLAYPTFKDLKYPKPGYPNPVADLYIHPLGGEAWKVTYEEPLGKRDLLDDLFGFVERGAGDETDGWGDKKLITNVEWMGNDMVMVSETNRVSDHFRGVLVDVKAQTGVVVRDEKIDEGWFEISHDMMYIPKDVLRGRMYDGYIDIVERDGYNHLGYFSTLNASKPQYITGGNWEVTNGISAFDKETNLVYFMSTKKSSVERHLYSIHLTGQNMTSLTNTEKEGYYAVSFSPLAKYYQLTYEGPDIPYDSVLSTTDPTFELILENNSHLTDTLHKLDLPEYEYGVIKVNGFSLNYREIRPPNFDDTGKTKYPVLFHCYGGPVSQTVMKRFSLDWHRWLVSEPRLEYLVVEVDGRGTGFMGRKSRTGVRKQLGKLESSDQAAAAEMWKRKAYVNPEKVALWGWSYGGFLTLKTIESHPGAFPYAMAVAPVTDWRYYDSIYTERYMLTPEANPLGYRASAVRNVSAMGEAKRFFLAHGTGDDNVHVQNSLTLMDLLTQNGIRNWDSQVFTDDDHSIVFHGGSRAIHWRLAEWLERWFGRKEVGGRVWKVDGELIGYTEGVEGDKFA